jgi:hypothetical protein
VVRKIALIALLLLAGCGSGGGGDEAAPATQATTTTTTAAVQAVPAKELVAKLKQAGLPVGKVQCFTEENDPNDLLGRPGGYIEKCDWADKREEQLTADDLIGGSFEVYDTPEDAAARAEYLGAFEGASALSTGYTWVVPEGGSTVLRVDQELTPKQAKQYHSAALAQLQKP